MYKRFGKVRTAKSSGASEVVRRVKVVLVLQKTRAMQNGMCSRAMKSRVGKVA
jgi:hypothetical protein